MAEASSQQQPRQDDAQREEMLDRMLTRLALAEDSSLQTLLAKILPYSISSLSSSSPSVRKMVMEILSHVNKRVKNQTDIGLPLLELWNMYREESACSMVRNFCIVYIEMAFQRLPLEEKGNMASELLVGLSKLPAQHQDIILRIVAKAIGECHPTKVSEDAGNKYKAISSALDRAIFVEFCLHTILYNPHSLSVGCPPGLSHSQSNRVTGKVPLKGDTLLTRKVGILNIIDAMDIDPQLVYPLYLAACSDSQESVIKRGEELLKKKTSGVNLEDPNLISRLFLLFNGTVGIHNIAVESKVIPASPTLRLRLMSVFCRSIAAANAFPSTLQCIFGCIYGSETTTKLKQLGMEFTVWVFKHATQEQLTLMGPVILSGILRSLDNQLNTGSELISMDVKGFAYQAIGLLAVRLPQLFRDKTDMALRLFNALRVEDQVLRFIIQEATTSLATAYKDASAGVLKELEAVLLENSRVEQSEVRLCAVRWAISIYDMQNCPSRFICMIGTSDSKLDIREMAVESLCLAENYRQSDDPKFPKLADMLDYIFKQQPKLFESPEVREEKLFFPSKMYHSMIDFLMKCFDANSCQDDFYSTPEYDSSIVNLCLLLEHAMALEGGVELHAAALSALVSTSSRVPKLIASRYAERVSWMKQFLCHIDSDTRESSSRLLGIASSSLSPTASSDLIMDLTSFLDGRRTVRFECHHGTLCAMGYIVAECVKENMISDSMLQSAVDLLVHVVESEGSTLASMAMEALGHIALRCLLPKVVRHATSAEILSILRERLCKLLGGDDKKAIQKIVISLGHISVKEISFSHINIALELILGLCHSKVEDVLFSCGEALSFIWGEVPVTADIILKSNFTSLSQTSNFLTGKVSQSHIKSGCPLYDDIDKECSVMAREVITRKLFDVLLYSNRKDERYAGTVWLVSLIIYCGHQPKIQELLPDIQEAFSHLLWEQNELTQEMASQGMSIVYELGDSSMKQNLVNNLVSTLTSSGKRKRVVKLMEDTEVFQEGAIGKNPSGGKLSTYKELCSLANEMGQPDLIYKFMDLANYHASLNSKRGAAFGFSKIAKLAGDALQPHLGSLVPRLVRYQYDPDKNIQDAMSHIWKSIVADSKNTIDEYFDSIVDDLLAQSSSRLWRSREASCRALSDLIQGRKFIQVSKHLKGIWNAAFRAMDDIKETVRNAGDSLCRSVSSLTIRLCDVSLTTITDASATMDVVLPLLLSEGIMSKVASIQKASVAMVMKLSKGAGIALRPHLSDLVCCMLESLSSLEDQRLNYIELHAGNVGMETEKLENLRISVAKDSPMWETLDLCLKVVDTKSLDLLIPRLAQLVRTGVGLNTRVGVANFVSLLVKKINADVKPFTSMLLKLLFRSVLEEKSGVAKRAFASACAITLRYAGPVFTQKIMADTAALHSGDRNSQISCGILLENYASIATDVISGYHDIVLPVAFISRFEDDNDVSSLFEEVWEDLASSERISLQLYLSEIVSVLCDCCASSSWASKRKAAKAMSKLSEILGESLFPVYRGLLECLLKEVPGRLWEGKEAILFAISSLCSSCHKAIAADDAAIPNVIISTISSACTKKVKSYRVAAFSCLQQVIVAFDKSEFFRNVFPMLIEICGQTSAIKPVVLPSLSTSEDAGDDDIDTSTPLDKVIDCATACIHVALIEDILEQRSGIILIFTRALSPGFSWTVKASAFSSIRELCSKFREAFQSTATAQDGIVLLHELCQAVAPKVIHCIGSIKISQIHVSASECLLDIIEVYKELVRLEERKDVFYKDEVIQLCEMEKNERARSLLRKSIAIMEVINKE